METLLELKNITKKFGDFTANDNVDFACKKGRVISLLGENGAGKSTLMKVIYGMHEPNSGEIYYKDKLVKFKSPRDAKKLGIQMVHQHFMLVDSLSIAENIVMGKEPQKYGFFKRRESEEKVRALSREYGLAVDPTKYVEDLSVGEKQRTEIIKALYHGADILILDEPTAVLTPQEIEELFKVIEKLKEDGKCIIVITHKLKETMDIADEIYVLRRGKMVGHVEKEKTNITELTEMMVGYKLKEFEKTPNETGDIVLNIEDLYYENLDGAKIINGININVRSGEIFGIAGVEGNGQKQLMEIISGIINGWKGNISILGEDIKEKSSEEIIKMGVANIHSDRHERGLILDLDAEKNVLLGYQNSHSMLNKFNLIDYDKVSNAAHEVFEKYDVRPHNTKGIVKNFSGGNQQKIIVGRELLRDPKLVLVAYPTRGVDIGVSDTIHESILQLRSNGAAILLITSDFDELFRLSDRIGVVYEGKIVIEGEAKSFNPYKLGYYMGGAE